MKFGLFSMNAYACSFPERAVRIAQLAEATGFESLWAGEHVVLPDPRTPESRMAPEERILDPVVMLTYLAAHTQRVLLGTGIIILPQRNPLVLAKELASLDELSGGRLLCGVGVGYVESEMRAIGVPFAERGARTDEYLDAMRAIWTQQKPAYHGQFVSFEGVQTHPQRNIPIVIGGHTPAAYRRAVLQGTGWYGFALDLSYTARCMAALQKALKQYERPLSLGELEISVTPSIPLTKAIVQQFADLGVHRLILMPPTHLDVSQLEAYITHIGETIIRQA
ncbi:LLM class F420-dependent oxidoreductase [Reticulibacter mediterranei]|uniref:LLM class F420-dependent oxidoreductase n=1 Tax=Reticulibacter mediterranei TaxID=2778369 RepID=A0A8J3J1Q7_9CHLR|nr:LLM class F420-dependent oxidoreductase [Reticulibacter mediterranei]GHP00007.1 LLM class F420-dependent oxidoreductase [Reticulibacter mediterranei]